MTNKAPIPNDQYGHVPWSLVLGALLVIGIWSLGLGCDRPPAQLTPAKSPRVASLVPAATDLIVGMGAADHLVAVSNWDSQRGEIKQFPRVGDYQSTDWEKLAELRPDVMIVFMAGERIPAGFQQRADTLHIKVVNIKTERLEDIFQTSKRLGELLNEQEKANRLVESMQLQLDAVKKRVVGMTQVPTLVARDEEGYALIAGDTFIDDLLTIAGGRNVAGDFPMRYPNVDGERLIELSPQAIIQLLPDAPPHVVERSKQAWMKLTQLPAVKEQRVYILTDWYTLQPGSHVGELAQKLADILHPAAP